MSVRLIPLLALFPLCGLPARGQTLPAAQVQAHNSAGSSSSASGSGSQQLPPLPPAPPTPPVETFDVSFEIMNSGKMVKKDCAVCHFLEVQVDGKSYQSGEVATLPKGKSYPISVKDTPQATRPASSVKPHGDTAKFTVMPAAANQQILEQSPAGNEPTLFLASKDDVVQYIIGNQQKLLVRNKDWPKSKAEEPMKKNASLIPVEINVNKTAETEDDLVAVSNGTDPDLSTELSIKLASGAVGSYTADLSMFDSDGDIKFDPTTVTLTAGTAKKVKMWGKAPSSARDSSTVQILIKSGSAQVVAKKKVTVFEKIKVEFSGTFYSPVDVRDYGRRPWDGMTPFPPGHYLHPVTTPPTPPAPLPPSTEPSYPGILAQDTGDFSSRLVFWDGDQGVTKRTWSTPPVKVLITKLESINPPFELTKDALIGGEVHTKNGRFIEIRPKGGNDLIRDLEIELRKATKTAPVSSLSTAFDKSIEPATGGRGISNAKALLDLQNALTDPSKDKLANWIKNIYIFGGQPAEVGLFNMARQYEDESGFGAKWENQKFTHNKGNDFEGSAVAKALAGWQEKNGNERIQVYFEMRNFYEWELKGDLDAGSIETK